MNDKKTIQLLNKLIQINNDRFEGYETAFKETDEQYLKILFSSLMLTSQKCKQTLINEVVRYGGVPTESTRIAGKLFRVLMDVKAAITGKDQKAILNSCLFGEHIALETYQNMLDNDLDNLSFEEQKIINAQMALLRADYEKIKLLHEDLVASS
jgi:uncharacterized protein (TIGR02284 family)